MNSQLNLRVKAFEKDLESLKKKNELLELKNFEQQDVVKKLEQEKTKNSELCNKTDDLEKTLQLKIHNLEDDTAKRLSMLQSTIKKYMNELDSTYETISLIETLNGIS